MDNRNAAGDSYDPAAMIPKNPSAFRTVSAIIGLASLMAGAADAAILFYDGFAAGGATPAAGQYVSSPASTNGLDNSSLVRSIADTGNGQAPTALGFSTAGWRTGDGVSSAVHGRISSTGLNYTGLTTAAGSVDIFRSGSSASAQTKNYNRAVTTGLGVGATQLYFSALMNFDAGVRGQVGIAQVGISSIFSFGFDSAGKVAVYGNGGTLITTSSSSYTAATTYMLVAYVHGANLVDIYLNPTDFTNQSANAGQLVLSNVALTGFTIGTAITDVRLTADTGPVTDPNFLIDEIHGATTWSEVFLNVPEPSAVMLGAMAAAIGIGRRRRA